MGFLLVQGGDSLYKVDPATGAETELTLPTGVTLSTTRKPRFAILNQWVVMVNSPTRNLVIDPEGTVRVLTPLAPSSPPNVAAGSGTGLTGDYQVKASFVVEGSDGQLYMESPLSPASAAITLSNTNIALTRIPKSGDTITKRRLYRTAAGGTEYFRWFDVDGNTVTSAANGLADAGLALLPAVGSDLTAPPGSLPGTYMKAITSWRSILWGVADDPDLVDTIFYTAAGKVYAWPNSLNAFPKGLDEKGVIGFAPRRNELGILKRNGVWQITGDSNLNFRIVQIVGGTDQPSRGGCIAEDSIVVIGDRGYWLGNDGVYEWGPNGVNPITDDDVAPWFTSDTYFNRSRFPNAFAKYNKVRNTYDLHLAAVGSSDEDRWVSFNLTNRKWYGPHLTALFTPSHAAAGVDTNGLPLCLVGSTDGIVYTANAATFRDGAATAIDFDCFGRFHHGDAPDVHHYWGLMSVLSKIEAAGTLTVTPYLGGLNASAGTAKSHTLTTGRQVLGRIGFGRLMRLRMRQNTVNQGVSVFGYEIPYSEVGRR